MISTDCLGWMLCFGFFGIYKAHKSRPYHAYYVCLSRVGSLALKAFWPHGFVASSELSSNLTGVGSPGGRHVCSRLEACDPT